ncbi:DUF4179 domain-containing protein [Clostridium lundense]|uniref:DUF4179 domain-containing protein n=1 Tax=Clostridium lundense TaxID=319475 RepID=UPI0004873451|nr:DUF4179 domain-containing protein [Clostridium lundense]
MDYDFKNINLQDVDLEEYNSIDIRFSSKEKENIKKNLRKKIEKRKSKRKDLAAAIASVLILVLLVSNGNSVLANVLPTFNRLYESIGFKSEYLSQSVYIGKTYEENGIKITLENLTGTNHVMKVAVKVQYSDKWTKLNRPLVHFGCGFEGKLDTGSSGGLKDIGENTQLWVVEFASENEFPMKGNFNIMAISDGFKKPIVWDMKVDFSKNFKETIEKGITMSKDIGVTINHIEINTLGTIMTSNNNLVGLPNGESYYLKVDNKIYPILGSSWGKNECHTFMQNVSYNSIKNSKNISLVKHSIKSFEKIATKEMTKEEGIKNDERIKKQLDKLPKGEISGVIYTKKITFNNGNKAEIYNIERKDGKIRVYIKGDDKKQVFNMLSDLYTSTGILVQGIEETSEGYIAEFDDVSQDKVTIKLNVHILDCKGDYNEDESELTLK